MADIQTSPPLSQPMSQPEVDELLWSTKAQVAEGRFDANNQQLITQLVEGFNDTRGMVRLGFAELLGDIGKPATPALIEGLAHHQNPTVRRACAKTMTLIADQTTIPTLVHSLLHDDDTVVQGSVVGALAVMGEAAAPVLLNIVASNDYTDTAKGLATWGLSFVGTAGADYLYQAVDSDQAEVRSAVIGALTTLVQENEDQQALAMILSGLSDPSDMVRSEAAAALGKLNDATVVPHLTTVLTDKSVDVRKTAAMAMMKIGDASAIAPLQNVLDTEIDDTLQPVLKLAITQLQRKQEEEEDSWE